MAQAKDLRSVFGFWMVDDLDRFALAKVITTAVGAKLPDFFVRALLWLRSHGRYRLKVVGLHNLPSDGPVILATNCDRFDSCMQVVTATDRFTRFILLEDDGDEHPPWLLRYLARRTGLMALRSHGKIRQAPVGKGHGGEGPVGCGPVSR